MNLKEFILSDKVFSKCTPFIQASLMNELDNYLNIVEEYNNIVLLYNAERKKNEELSLKYRQLEHKYFNLKEKVEKAYRNQLW